MGIKFSVVGEALNLLRYIVVWPRVVYKRWK